MRRCKAYERGSILKRHCQAKLEEARLRVERIRVPENDADELALEH